VLQHNKQVCEIHVTQEQTHGRHYYVCDKGVNDRSEGRSDYDTDGHVDHGTTHGKLFEVLEQVSSPPFKGEGGSKHHESPQQNQFQSTLANPTILTESILFTSVGGVNLKLAPNGNAKIENEKDPRRETA
jgi:hypothetical protein